MKKQRREPLKCTLINETDCPLSDKCQYESVVYKVEVIYDYNAVKNN